MKKKKHNLPLFEIRARKQHPKSSHADCKRQDKKLPANMEYALVWIRKFPGHSARELEGIAHCAAGRIWKVAAQLERRKLIYRIRRSSKPMLLFPAI